METVSQDESTLALFSNRRLMMESLLQIENKERQLVPFILNPIQLDMDENSGYRDVYVKPASVGATSYHLADFYIDNITLSGTVSVIISYDETNAKRLIIKAKRYHQFLSKKIPTVPKLEHKGAEELTWEHKDTRFYSIMYIFSSRSYSIGRGEPIHNLLLDEYGFWYPGTHESVFASAVQRVPLKVGTKIKILSTPNGEDNPFCEVYRAAKEGTAVGKSVFKHHFYPWFIHPEYIMYKDDPFCLEGDDEDPLPNLMSDEALLMRVLTEHYRFNELDAMAKLRWRRYKKHEVASMRRSGDTVLLFEQEFPEDDESCFLVAGDQAYSSDVITDKVRQCIPAPTEKAIIATDPMTKSTVSATLDIWHDRIEGYSYVASIDPGKGKTSESVGHVWHFEDGYTDKEGKEIPPIMQHCATLAGFYDEWEMALLMKEVGHYFNGAVIAPEDNLDIVSHLRDYPDLYWREDVRTGKMIRAVGWQTNMSTKPYMITEVSRHLEHIDSQDIRFWSQCKNIRRNPMVKSGVLVVGADDHHDAGAIAIVCRSAQPVQRGYVGSTSDSGSGGWTENWGR
jgi:hypothetical protein